MNRKQRRAAAKGRGSHGRPRRSSVRQSGGAEALMAEAARQHQAGRLDEAEATCELVLKAEPANAQAIDLKGVLALARGRAGEAEALASQAVALCPERAAFHYNLGQALAAQGKSAAAAAAYGKAAALRPDHAEAHFCLANALHRLGRAEEAVAAYREAIAQRPDFPAALNNLGVSLKTLDRPDEAEAAYRRALACDPDYASAYSNLGNVLREKGQLEEAESVGRKAIALQPDFVAAHSNLGLTLQQAEKYDEAIAACRRAIALQPDYAEAHFNLGNVLKAQDRLADADAAYRRAIAIKPDYPEAYNNLAITLKARDRFAEAEAAYRRALDLRPGYAEAHNNLGGALQAQGRIEEAIAAYGRASDLQPDFAAAHWNEALALLLAGRFQEGWDKYEWRWKWEDFPSQRRSFAQPLWDGSPLDGRTILLHAEQGVGDAIQFVRYAPLVAARGGRVIVECPDSLMRLLETAPGVSRVVAKGTLLPDFAAQAPLLSLPRLFDTRLETIPAEVPYLSVPAGVAAPPLEENGAAVKAGIVWAGSPIHKNDRARSCGLEKFAALREIPGLALYSLQVGPRAGDLEKLAPGRPIRDLGAALTDFAVTAKLVTELDLVITVDTAMAHLAGALGRPVWVLLPFAPDWRWLLGRDDSPWYPTMRLFRQPAPGDWDSVFAALGGELGKVVGGR